MDIPTFQRSLAIKSRLKPEHRFGDLLEVAADMQWLRQALDNVLSNRGARTAGIDGITRDDLKTDKRRDALAKRLHSSLRSGNYHPKPVRRVYIPKPGKDEMRPLGIPTIADRTVQEALRMIMEPIWESRFLTCSHGFRPGHCTMDCIHMCRMRIQMHDKFFWVVEGDIRKCFDQVTHRILLGQFERVIDDHQLLDVCARILEAGVMEDGLVSPTLEGTPQGGIISPLWTNIYLNDFDQWYWNKYRNLAENQRRGRRAQMQGNAQMTRYADDFIVLTNGSHKTALDLREEIAEVLWDRLRLELNMDKTKVTHVQDGFEFLGFHLKWHPKSSRVSKAWLRITPTRRNVHKVRDKLRDLTQNDRILYIPDRELFQAANAIVRGWAYYYHRVNATEDFRELDWWVNQRMLLSLIKKHRLTTKEALAKYKKRQTKNAKGKPCNRWNLYADGIWLFCASDVKIEQYWTTKKQWESNPYETLEKKTILTEKTPFENDDLVFITKEACKRAESRRETLMHDDFTCQDCGRQLAPEDLEVHHKKRRSRGGKYNPANVVTLCKECHVRRGKL